MRTLLIALLRAANSELSFAITWGRHSSYNATNSAAFCVVRLSSHPLITESGLGTNSWKAGIVSYRHCSFDAGISETYGSGQAIRGCTANA